MKPTPRIIKAADPQALLIFVQEALSQTEDLHQPLFVSYEGLLCQPVIAHPGMHDYRLIVARDLLELEVQTQNLTLLDFDPIFNVVLWNGKYLQWMQKLNAAGMTVREAVVKLTKNDFMPAAREDELALVEGAHAGLNIRPIPPDESLTIPFPVRLS